MAPYFAAAAHRLPRLRFVKVDTEAAPAMMLFLGGEELARRSGALPAEALVDWLQEQIDAGASAG